jgi:hypothetical protein
MVKYSVRTSIRSREICKQGGALADRVGRELLYAARDDRRQAVLISYNSYGWTGVDIRGCRRAWPR